MTSGIRHPQVSRDLFRGLLITASSVTCTVASRSILQDAEIINLSHCCINMPKFSGQSHRRFVSLRAIAQLMFRIHSRPHVPVAESSRKVPCKGPVSLYSNLAVEYLDRSPVATSNKVYIVLWSLRLLLNRCERTRPDALKELLALRPLIERFIQIFFARSYSVCFSQSFQ